MYRSKAVSFNEGHLTYDSYTCRRCISITILSSQKALRVISGQIVRKYPFSFQGKANGKATDDGIRTFMLKLESQKENLNTPLTSKTTLE